jgi:hypothetical protein
VFNLFLREYLALNQLEKIEQQALRYEGEPSSASEVKIIQFIE